MTVPKTGTGAIRAALPRLVAAGVAGAARDARLLLAHAMEIAPDRLTLQLSDPLTPRAAARYQTAIAARVARQPLSQITGKRLFWNRSFTVTPDVLDPRPETELLVRAALSRPFARMADLGTGSGCILLSCLADMPNATGLGCDISDQALAVAASNAAALGLTGRATFRLSDWFSAIEGRFDLITANPPYLALAEMAALSPEVRFEPRIALTTGGDGLDAYRAISQSAPARLLSGGRLIVEIGPTQAQQVAAMLARAGLCDIQILQDLDGRDRVVSATKPA